MMNMFAVQEQIDLDMIDALLKDFRILRTDVSESEACKLKFSNRSSGVAEETQKAIDGIVFKINNNKFPKTDDERLLKVIDLLTLYANHIDQQTSDAVNQKLSLQEKESKVLRWLEAAYSLSKRLIPNLDELITAEKKDNLLGAKQETLSSLSLMLHYLGKARRYNKEISVEARLPVLATALIIAKQLESSKDLHYYSGRVATFELPVVYCLRDLKKYSLAAKILQEQLKKAYDTQNLFHMIQGHVQVAEVAREQYLLENKGIEESIDHALKAVELVKNSTTESFKNNPIYFNARVALMKAYQAADDKEAAQSIAHDICDEYEQNKNCGAKQPHLDEAQKVLSQMHSLSM